MHFVKINDIINDTLFSQILEEFLRRE